MNYSKIKYNGTANGPGIRTNLFVSGCNLKCPGCFNYNIWNYQCGEVFTEETMQEILDSMHDGISGLSILGGDPTSEPNIKVVTKIARRFKKEFPDKSLWVWSGYKLDFNLDKKDGEPHYEFPKDGSNPRFFYGELLKYADVIVDGRWEIQNYDPNLLWAGSTNQRVIDIKNTIKKGSLELLPNYKES